jgi:tetratricopeptide (TPR) repeat protein
MIAVYQAFKSEAPTANRVLLLYVIVILLCALSSRAEIPKEQLSEMTLALEKPVKIQLNNGSTLTGHSIKVINGTLQIATSEGIGEIIYSITPDQIKRFEIPGEYYKALALEEMRSGNQAAAIEIMKRLYEQRINLIAYLPVSEANYFALYVDLLKSVDPSKAIAVANTLSPYVNNPKAIKMVEIAKMESYHVLGIYDKASSLAQQWQATHTLYEDSALSEFILAEDLLRKENYEAAIDLALQPIVFSGPSAKDKLADCYAVAIASAIGLRDFKHANLLYREMQERELLWPTQNDTLLPYFEKLNKQLEDS